MNSFPVLSAPTPRLSVPSRQYYRSVSGSPTRQHHFQQHVDDLIAQLTPASAIRALRFPTGALKQCLETATASEQSFAQRAALASSQIQEWLDEVSLWPWPDGGGSAGFEKVAGERRIGETSVVTTEYVSSSPPSSPSPARVRIPTTPATPERQILGTAGRPDDVNSGENDGPWMGSLLAADVSRYEARIAEIGREIDDLEVEDMKRHVLHHHIFPLSPPGTPSIDGRLRASSSSSSTALTKMDDLTAVVTAIVLQALPQLSKLVRLLDVWHVRLLVLKRIPALLASLIAAENAIQSAWHAIHLGDESVNPSSGLMISEGPSLRREEFKAMKSVVEEKVSKAAQITDFMLDSLDGWEDTIPEHWIDRIDAAEREYGDWVAACERKIREREWKMVGLGNLGLFTSGQKPVVISSVAAAASSVHQTTAASAATDLGQEQQGDTLLESQAPELLQTTDNVHDGDSPSSMRCQTTPLDVLSHRGSLESLGPEPELPSIPPAKAYAETESDSPAANIPTDGTAPPSGYEMLNELSLPSSVPASPLDDIPGPANASDLQEAHGREVSPGVDTSPTSSPPDFRASLRSTVTFSDMPTVTEIPGEESPTAPKTPVDSSFVFDDVENGIIDLSQDIGSPSSPGTPSSRRLSVSSEDDQLQQQISEILESIPAKIHLSSQPSPLLNQLNPPDFKLPRKPKPTTDSTRSLSSMSSRSMTPSFLLAPAYARNPRPRHQRGNQEIKLYHLSRSTGEAPIKLFIRLVGENGERVMVRVGGGWADLSEYLKEYASHHSRRSKSGGDSKIEIRDLPPTVAASSSATTSLNSRIGSSPPSRPGSALDSPVAMTPLNVRKTRKATGDEGTKNPRTPLAVGAKPADSTPSSGTSTRSRSSSRLSWTEEDSTLGMSGPKTKNIEMSEESRAWVESVKERVRIASGERRVSDQLEGKFGEIGKVGGTKRLFRKGQGKS